jgi:hypothetical protein
MTASPLTREDVLEIRRLYDAGMSPREIWQMARFRPKAAQSTIARVARRETFREIGVGATERALVANRLARQSRLPLAPSGLPLAPSGADPLAEPSEEDLQRAFATLVKGGQDGQV